MLVGCNGRDNNERTLSVTIEPQRYFLEQIVGDKFVVKSIVPSGSNPESFDLAPMQLIDISNSFAYFKVGFLGIENTWIENIKKNNPNLKFVDCSVNISSLEHICNDHRHNHEGDNDHNHGHDGADPHIWSSPATAKVMVENMYKAILELDVENEDYYTDNYNNLLAEINKTDSIIKTYIDKAPCKKFIIYHPALSYYANEYGLEQYTIEYEGKNPSPAQLKELIDKSKENNVTIVFVQQEFDAKNAETIVKEINGKAIPINLMSYAWSEEMIKIAKSLAQK